jgi:hypothetical protein
MIRSRLLSTPRSFLFTTGDERPAGEIRLGLKNITDNETANACIDRSYYFVDVIDISVRQVKFTFYNHEPGTGCITRIYFNDGDLCSLSVQIVMDAEAAEEQPDTCLTTTGSCQSVPRPYHDSTTFQAVRDCPNKAGGETAHDGICRGESLGVVFELQAGITFADIIAALSRGKLNISIVVLDTLDGNSTLFINDPHMTLRPALQQQKSKIGKSA